MKSQPRQQGRKLPAPFASLRWILLLLGCCLAAFLARPVPEARAAAEPGPLALVNAASYDSAVAPGSIGALFGSGMTGQAAQAAATIPLPTTLAGLSVKVNGLTAPLFYASATQINLQVPSGVAPGTATVEVFSNGSTTPVASGTVTVADAAPGVFTFSATGQGQAVVLNSDYTLNSDFDTLPASRPEASGKFVIIYATGIGNTNPLVADGQAAPASPLAVATDTTTVTIGGVSAQVLFSGLAPGFVGLWQINAVLPESLPTNLATSLRVDLKTRQSLQTTLAVANKNEFGSVTGSVVNALTGAPLGSASISLQPTGSGKTRSATTNGQGQYSLFVISPGGYNLSASATGFLTATQGATVTGGQDNTLAPIALTPPLVAGQYRIVMTWQSGIDLDAHLTGPASGNRFHVWWNGETDLGTPVTAQFDRDDTTGTGPETVTFNPGTGLYRFSVQNYTQRDTNGSNGLAQAGVMVRVYLGSQQVALITAPSGGGTLWRVLEINNGILNVVNTLTDEPDPSNIKVTF
jgi:uncharacterized protein (TIGR03437 family)